MFHSKGCTLFAANTVTAPTGSLTLHMKTIGRPGSVQLEETLMGVLIFSGIHALVLIYNTKHTVDIIINTDPW